MACVDMAPLTVFPDHDDTPQVGRINPYDLFFWLGQQKAAVLPLVNRSRISGGGFPDEAKIDRVKAEAYQAVIDKMIELSQE